MRRRGSGQPVRATILILAVLVWVSAGASAQEAATRAADASALQEATADNVAEGMRLLEGVRDNVFSFDDPAFYWFCRHVREAGDASLYSVRGDEVPTPWRFLLERPGDYRGRLVVVEGLLQAVHTYDVANRTGVGTLYQCELSEVGTRAFCTVVVTRDPGEISLHSRVRAKGYFIKARAFQTSGGEAGAGPLLVARSLELVRAPTGMPWQRRADGAGSSAWWNVRSAGFWLMPGTAGLAVVWLILRRRVRGAKADAKGRAGGVSGRSDAESEEDFDWMTKGNHDSHTGEQ